MLYVVLRCGCLVMSSGDDGIVFSSLVFVLPCLVMSCHDNTKDKTRQAKSIESLHPTLGKVDLNVMFHDVL